MKTTRFIGWAVAVLISTSIYSYAQAQTGAVVSFKGIEVSAGHAEPGEVYGWMCYARTTGALPGNFTLTMDLEGDKSPGTLNSVARGGWTLPVYMYSTLKGPIRQDNYQGMLYGNIQSGTIVWDKTGTTGNVELKLEILGGTQAMAEIKGTAALYGTMTYDEKGAGAFSGSIVFEFQ